MAPSQIFANFPVLLSIGDGRGAGNAGNAANPSGSRGSQEVAHWRHVVGRIALGGVHWSPLGCGPVGCRWHKGFGPGVHESTDSVPTEKHPSSDRATPVALMTLIAPLERRGPMRMIMRATLHDHAPSTY